MYELALSEWGLTPEYINRHWTEEMLGRMLQIRNDRLVPPKVPSNVLFEKMGQTVHTVRAGRK